MSVTPFTNLPEHERPCVRTMGGDQTIAIVTTPRCRPKMVMADGRGYNLGLFDYHWASHTPVCVLGAGAYRVVIEPICQSLTDADGNYLRGTRCQPTGATGDAEWIFEPFPDGFACDGYNVYASDNLAVPVYYFQGVLRGRFTTHFTIGPAGTFVYAAVTTIPTDAVGPPQFAHACEVYQGEGSVDTRLYLAGGREYREGYAKVVPTSLNPTLTGSTGANSTVATWNTVTAGGFRMRMDNYWFDIGPINFSTATGMYYAAPGVGEIGVANLITAALNSKYPGQLFATPTTTSIGDWNAIVDGSFDVWIYGTQYHVVDCDFHLCADMAEVALVIQNAIQDVTLAGETCEWDATGEKFVISNDYATDNTKLSYLYTSSHGNGTDISGMIGGRDISAGVVLNPMWKDDGTDYNCTWVTDHFVIDAPGADTDDAHRLSFLETPDRGDWTDLSGESYSYSAGTGAYMWCCEAPNLGTMSQAVYRPGQEASYGILGLDTAWGDWAQGMRILFDGDSKAHLIDRYIDSGHLVCDDSYSGVAANQWTKYTLIPYSSQVYPSELANPFNFQPDTIIQCPTADNDTATGLRVIGRNLGAWMKHHVFVIDAVNPQSPRLVTDQAGALTNESIVWDGMRHLFFDGNQFWSMQWNAVQELDMEQRMRDVLARITSERDWIAGIFDSRFDQQIAMWLVALDGSEYLTHAICFKPSTNSWWLRRYNDANAIGTTRDESNQDTLYTGARYADPYAVNAFVFEHGSTYYSDGAQDPADAKTKEGIVKSVASASTAKPYIEGESCRASTLLTRLQAVTNGAFAIDIDGESYTVTALDLSGAATAAAIAVLVQAALVTAGATGATCTYATATSPSWPWPLGRFRISGATAGSGSVDYMRSYEPEDYTDLSGIEYLDMREGRGTIRLATSTQSMDLYKPDGTTAADVNTADGETGIWAYFCDANYENGFYSFVRTVTDGNTIVIAPASSTLAAGWHWYLGGINPTWTKWFDFGAAHLKHKERELAVACTPQTAEYTMAAHEMHSLSTTVRARAMMTFGSTNDVTQTKRFSDRPSTHLGITLDRPSATVPLEIESIILTHRTEV